MSRMQPGVMAAVAGAAVAGLLAVSVMAAEPTAIQAGAAVTKPAGKGERHPEIRKGIALLERAKEVLQDKAARDFAGHREKAVDHIEQALVQLREALEADKK